MTPFEEKIYQAMGPPFGPELGEYGEQLNDQLKEEAKKVAQMVLLYIKEAFDANPCTDIQNMCGTITYEDLWENFQVRNGLK